ncbi:TetR/AcrR family transcriptional regulator [Tardiphaga sp.]|uniref:TetR/AcrR family transcriptional regulator n=1 Tax=Tardiphaga sp. TaxID=1926292 RepID=UPI00261B76A6|nr:TetR/AcrR family transcriptional regulator [Tardiphaga sp.]
MNTSRKTASAKATAAKAAPRKPAPSRTAPVKAKSPARKAATPAPYHHGDLPGALLKAAESLLESAGLPGLTLRAVAREAGVSHAAPTHHFGDLTGLLSELAAVGFQRFHAHAEAAQMDAATPAQAALARAGAYLSFARTWPGMFTLMFRADRLDMTRPSLRDAADAAFGGLAASVGAQGIGAAATAPMTLAQAAQIARAWSVVHGFSMLLLDGRLCDMLRRLPAGTTPEMLFVEMLASPNHKP